MEKEGGAAQVTQSLPGRPFLQGNRLCACQTGNDVIAGPSVIPWFALSTYHTGSFHQSIQSQLLLHCCLSYTRFDY